MTVRLLLPNGEAASYDVAMAYVSKYTLEEIFKKKLLLFLPFYLFAYEKRFKLYETNPTAREDLVADYRKIIKMYPIE